MTPPNASAARRQPPQRTAAEQRKRRESLRPHPARDKIIDYLRKHSSPQSPTRMAPALGLTLGATAYHVRVLVAAGMVHLARERRVRGAVEHYYALVDDPAVISDGDFDALLKVAGALTVTVDDGDPPVRSSLDDASREELMAVIANVRPRVLDRVGGDATQREGCGLVKRQRPVSSRTMREWEETFDLVFRTNLRKQRLDAGLEPAEVADRAGLEVEEYIALEEGRRVNPLSSVVLRLSEALQITPADLSIGVPEPPGGRGQPRRWPDRRRRP